MATSNSPAITLVFRGLFLFAFERERRFCQVGIMQAERHCLKIKIKTKAASLSSSPTFSFKVPDGNLFFEVLRRGSGVDTYEPGPFKRDPAHDPRDFRWALDFEGSELHDRQLPFKAGALKRSIFIDNGLFYTHDTQLVRIKRPSSTSQHDTEAGSDERLSPALRTALIARSVGCDIYLPNRKEFRFRYGPQADYSITLKKEPNISYEILVDNRCPREKDQVRPEVGDFLHYYEVIDLPENERFDVLPADDIPDPEGVDDVNPCNPAYVGLTSAPLH